MVTAPHLLRNGEENQYPWIWEPRARRPEDDVERDPEAVTHIVHELVQ